MEPLRKALRLPRVVVEGEVLELLRQRRIDAANGSRAFEVDEITSGTRNITCLDEVRDKLHGMGATDRALRICGADIAVLSLVVGQQSSHGKFATGVLDRALEQLVVHAGERRHFRRILIGI
jgi:hypothetical protein